MLNYNLIYQDLYTIEGLTKIHNLFLQQLKENKIHLYDFLLANYEKNFKFGDPYANDLSDSIEIAQCLETFILDLFQIQEPYQTLRQTLIAKSQLFMFRTIFLNKKIKFVTSEELEQLDFNDIKDRLYRALNIETYNEEVMVDHALKWLKDADNFQQELHDLKYFGAFIFFNPQIAAQFPLQKAFFRAKKTNFDALLDVAQEKNIYQKSDTHNYIIRSDFNYYNKKDILLSLQESNYCVKCHKRSRDTCKTGIKTTDANAYQINPIGIKLEGCPLNMHISQMHILNETHNLIAALVMITINNPLVAATGDTICVDCETSCIFQKQQAVETPMVETSILNNILNLPWGFEIYSLLTKWNPLRFYRHLPKINTHKNILISGLGPSGFASAYNMALEGHNCIAIDMVKIEPLSDELITNPVKKLHILSTPLQQRTPKGFGGVAEYGITSRWNKNFLQIIQLILAKQHNIAMYGNIRLGSSISIQDCIDILHFDHIILCNGSGKPNLLNLENSFCKGMKTASEFLMVLHSGAFMNNSNIHMQIRLPIVVLGAGLTAVDAATEALLYYKKMLYKYIPQYLDIINTDAHTIFMKQLSEEDKNILHEYVEHYNLLSNAPSEQAQIKILQDLGGCKIIYYKDLLKANAYKINHKELQKAIDQGIIFHDNLTISKIHVDQYNYLSEIEFSDQSSLKVRTLIIALGTNPNDIILDEERDIFVTDIRETLETLDIEYKGKKTSCVFHKYKDVMISYLGDMHKIFAGSVVKAIASSFYSINPINQMLKAKKHKTTFHKLKLIFNNLQTTILADIEQIAVNLYKLKFKNKNLANKSHPGHIFKIHNSAINFTQQPTLFNKPTFLTTTNIDKKNHIVETIMKIRNPNFVNILLANIGKPMNLLGPLGHNIEIPHNKHILLIGEGFTNNTIVSALEDLFKHNNKVTYLLSTSNEERTFFEPILSAFQCTFISSSDPISTILANYLQNIRENQINYIITSVMPHNLCNIKKILQESMLKSIPNKTHIVPSLFCGCKGICGACVTKLKDGKMVYACIKQEFNLDNINTGFTLDRLKQNYLIEQLAHIQSR